MRPTILEQNSKCSIPLILYFCEWAQVVCLGGYWLENDSVGDDEERNVNGNSWLSGSIEVSTSSGSSYRISFPIFIVYIIIYTYVHTSERKIKKRRQMFRKYYIRSFFFPCLFFFFYFYFICHCRFKPVKDVGTFNQICTNCFFHKINHVLPLFIFCCFLKV